MARSDTGTPDGPTRILLVSGIYPPDIGGPATHVADLRAELTEQGREITVLTLGDVDAIEEEHGIVRIPRRWPWFVRHGAAILWIVRHADRFEVIYAAGLHPAAVVGARAARRPVVVKIVGDPAWERASRRGLTSLDFDGFQSSTSDPYPVRAMRTVRNVWLRGSDAIVTPSAFLGEVVDRWLSGPSGVSVIPNGVRLPTTTRVPSPQRKDLRLIWVGRMIPLKRVDRLIEAVSRVADVDLVLIGDGPDRSALERAADESGARPRIRFTGILDHATVLSELRDSDALVLPSDIEGFPHVAIEAFALGVPLIAPAIGGLGELIRDGDNGLVLADPEVGSLASLIEKIRDDPVLLRQLSEGALRDGDRWGFERTAAATLRVLQRATIVRPRVAYLGRTRVSFPVGPELEAKLNILVWHVRPRSISTGRPGIRLVGRTVFVTMPDGPLLGRVGIYATGPLLASAMALLGRIEAVVCQSPYEGVGAIAAARLVPRSRRAAVIVEVHGDWRTASRLYGSRVRRVSSPLADRLAAWSLKNADAVRAISGWTAGLVEAVRGAPPDVAYPTFADLSSFSTPTVPPPAIPTVLYIGALERTKGIDVLLEAWPDVLARIPTARLVVAGSGTLRSDVEAAALDPSVDVVGVLSRGDVASAIDEASLVVVPSRSEGFGRVVLEAMARGRPVVASDVGGLTDLVVNGATGLLVEAGSPNSLSSALSDMLADPERCIEFGSGARRRFERLSPEETYDRGTQIVAGLASRR